MQDAELPEKIEPTTPNFQTELAAKIAEIAPEALSDGKLDVAKLRELVNGDAETAQEKFGLFWPGKRAAQALAQIPTTATLVPVPEESEDWENTKNLFIEGDNLEVLKALQNSYRRKVKMIYIDPPYNTGREFIYPDRFSEGLQGYLDYTGQKNEAGENTESKQETGGRRHSNWLNMMYPRLQLAKSLLTDDGAIFISIDDNEVDNLRLLCDEVFGEENFVAQIAWKKKYTGGRHARFFADLHEYILVYARTIVKLSDFELDRPDSEKQKFSERDEYYLERGGYYVRPLKSNLALRKTLIYPISLPDGSSIETQWLVGKERFEKELSEKRIEFRQKRDGSWNVYKKYYEKDGGGKIKPPSLIEQFPNTEGKIEIKKLFEVKEGRDNLFYTVKPVNLIKNLMSYFVNDGDLILDPFSGSGTTAHAAMSLSAEIDICIRNVQIQLPEPTFIMDDTGKEKPTPEGKDAYSAGYKDIAKLAEERIRRAGKKIREDLADKIAERTSPLDTGFRVYKLAPSNFVQWDENKAKDDIQQAVLDFAANKRPEAAPEALLAEIMLQSRIQLNAHIEKRDLQNGGWVYLVDGGNLIAYVADEQITEAQVNEIADLAPAKLVILDSAFNGNNALKINVMNICKEKFIKEFKTI